MGNGALPHGPSYRAHPRLYLNSGRWVQLYATLSEALLTLRDRMEWDQRSLITVSTRSLSGTRGLLKRRAQLVGVLATGGPPLPSSGIEASKKCPGIPCPSSVEQRVVPGARLVGQFRIAQFDRPLFDVQAKLWIVERQLIHASE